MHSFHGRGSNELSIDDVSPRRRRCLLRPERASGSAASVVHRAAAVPTRSVHVHRVRASRGRWAPSPRAEPHCNAGPPVGSTGSRWENRGPRLGVDARDGCTRSRRGSPQAGATADRPSGGRLACAAREGFLPAKRRRRHGCWTRERPTAWALYELRTRSAAIASVRIASRRAFTPDRRGGPRSAAGDATSSSASFTVPGVLMRVLSPRSSCARRSVSSERDEKSSLNERELALAPREDRAECRRASRGARAPSPRARTTTA